MILEKANLIRWALGVSTLALVLASPANATVFTSRGAFNAATSALTTVDFNNTAGASDTDVLHGGNYSLAGVSFANTGGHIFTVGLGDGFSAGTFYGNDYLEWEHGLPNTLTVTLPSSVTAMGFDFAELRGGSTTPDDVFTIQIGANTYVANTVNGAAAFFGVTQSTPFTQFTITDLEANGLQFFPTIDNLTFGAAGTVVPEPASLALLATGAWGVLRRQRKARKRAG